MVLLCIRAVVKDDLHASPFMVIHSSSARLPGQLVSPVSLKCTESVKNLIYGIRLFLHEHTLISPRLPAVCWLLRFLMHRQGNLFLRMLTLLQKRVAGHAAGPVEGGRVRALEFPPWPVERGGNKLLRHRPLRLHVCRHAPAPIIVSLLFYWGEPKRLVNSITLF